LHVKKIINLLILTLYIWTFFLLCFDTVGMVTARESATIIHIG